VASRGAYGTEVGALGEVAKSWPERGGRRPWLRGEGRGAAILLAPFVVAMLLVGIIPAVYALEQSLVLPSGGGFAGLANFATVVQGFDFLPSFENVGLLLLIWLPMMIVGVVGLALLVDAQRGRLGKVLMFLYYIPGALAGMANFMLWLLLLDPTVSPVAFLLRGFGAHTLDAVLAAPTNVVLAIAAMLFFQGAGSWLVIVYGGLNSISEEVLEAARIDGCDNWKMAWRIKLPIIAPWIGYLALMNFAYGFQIFLEPQVLSTAVQGLISGQWSPNELSYTYAYEVGNTGAAAALSIILLLVVLIIGVVIVTRTGLFDRS
jgi:multiple sugar transport system permease protein